MDLLLPSTQNEKQGTELREKQQSIFYILVAPPRYLFVVGNSETVRRPEPTTTEATQFIVVLV